MAEKNIPYIGGDEPLLKTEEVARLLNLSKSTVNNFAAAGIIPSITIGKSRRFHADDIRKIMVEGIDIPRRGRPRKAFI